MDAVEGCCLRLGWIDAPALLTSKPLAAKLPSTDAKGTSLCKSAVSTTTHDDAEPCLLRRCFASGRLNQRGKQSVSTLLAAGWSLRSRWPHANAAGVDEWLGSRLYFAHASLFSSACRLVSLVSSAVGRNGQRLPRWPKLVDRALRNIYQQNQQLLMCPAAAATALIQPFALRAPLAAVQAVWSRASAPDAWLEQVLSETLVAGNASEALANTIALHISPALKPAPAEFEELPLQDRVAIALADAVYALSVRPSGKIAQLLERRLSDHRFPPASIFVAIATDTSDGDGGRWLDRGAVGWYVAEPPAQARPLGNVCRARHLQCGRPVQQLCSGPPTAWNSLDPEQWSYLCHCTRGSAGPLPQESPLQFQDRLWLQEAVVELTPLETLARICCEGWLRGGSQLTRDAQPCVSFSAQPLKRLLEKRTFRPHLGRWDWEPYGLIIDRQRLLELGAQPVIYGTQADYEKLQVEQRPYFQPPGRGPRGSVTDWTWEREWRVLGDLNLHRLPRQSVRLFVRSKSEALQLSRWSPWPVFWTHGPSSA